MIICARPNLQISFEESLKIHKRLGFKYIRFDVKNIPENKEDLYYQKEWCIDIFKRYHALVKEAGMSFAEFHCFAVPDIDDFERLASVYLKLMKMCGVRYLSQHLREEYLEHPEKVNKVIKMFKDAGIYFCIENGQYFPGSFKKMDLVLEQFPDAYVAFDIGHTFLNDMDPEEFYDRYKEKIKVIHLHDFGKSDHEVPFTGKLLNMPSFVQKLRDFKDCIVLEIRAYTPDLVEQRYRQALENTKKFLLE